MRTMFLYKSAIFASLANLLVSFNISYFQSFLSVELIDMGLAQNKVGYVIASHDLAYLLLCLLYPFILHKIPRKI